MTARQRIKLKMMIDTRRGQYTDRKAFNQSMYGTWDCITDPVLVAELDRIENQRMGMTKLLTEVWNEWLHEVVEQKSIDAWTKHNGTAGVQKTTN